MNQIGEADRNVLFPPIDPLANYLTCGDETVSLDLFGLSEWRSKIQPADRVSCLINDELLSVDNYEWCGNSTFATSGWESIVDDFSNLPVAAYMSEYG